MRYLIAVIALALSSASVVQAGTMSQGNSTFTPEIRPFVGAFIPTGTFRDAVRPAAMGGLQGAIEIQPMVHALASFAWSPAKENISLRHDRVNVYSYDVGLELFAKRSLNDQWEFRPFIGLGGGASSYNPKVNGVTSHTYMDAYGALGAEFQMRQMALRLEGRDYATQWKGVMGDEKSTTRNAVMLSAGLAWHLR